MKKKPKVEEGLSLLKRATGQVAAGRRALEQSMNAPGGEEWEHSIAAPELEEESEPAAPKSPSMQARERRLRDLFTLNWSPKPKQKR